MLDTKCHHESSETAKFSVLKWSDGNCAKEVMLTTKKYVLKLTTMSAWLEGIVCTGKA